MKRTNWRYKERTQGSPRRQLLAIIACLCMFTACVLDPNPPTKAPAPTSSLPKEDLKPPMKMVAEVPLVGDAHALFVHQNTAYICTATEAGHGEIAYSHLSAVDLKTHKARWVAKENLCFFDANDTNVYIVREDKQTYNRLILEIRDAATGALKAQSAFGDKLQYPLTTKGPGRAVHQTPVDDAQRHPDTIKVVGKYVLFFNYLRAWVFDAETGKVILERGHGTSVGGLPDIFYATIHGDMLYTLETADSKQGQVTHVAPQYPSQTKGSFENTLRAIDLRTGKVTWQKELQHKILHATIAAQGAHIFVQAGAAVSTWENADFRYKFHASLSFNKHFRTTTHYYLHGSTGKAVWQKPWVMSGAGAMQAKPLPRARLLQMTPTHAYVTTGYMLYAISLKARNHTWDANITSSQLQSFRMLGERFIIKQNGSTNILDLHTGKTISRWSDTLLPPPVQPALGGATPTPKPADEDSTYVATHNCLRADGSVRTGVAPPGTRPYYDAVGRSGFFSNFCSRNRIQIHGVGKTTNDRNQRLWKSLTHIPQGTPELFFRHGKRIYAIANKYNLLSFELGH